MKYYSEKLNKVFDDVKSLEDEEKALEAKEAEKAKLAETKKERAHEIEEAYKKTVEARKQAKEIIEKADEEYDTLVHKFVKDFGSYHMTVTEDSEDGTEVSLSDLISSFWRNLPW